MSRRRLRPCSVPGARSLMRTTAVALAAACLAMTAGCSSTSTSAHQRATAAATSPPAAVSASGIARAPQSPTVSAPPTASQRDESAFNKSAFSIDDPASDWVVVNKSRALHPLDYAPTDLVRPNVIDVNGQQVRREVAVALQHMFAAGGSQAGLRFSLQSGYRSFAAQTAVYAQDVRLHGRAYADGDTARPGHSEHQTGLAVEISAVPARCSLEACFGQTSQGRWLAANAWRFGFLLRYPADKVAVTGFTYEPWHFRYIGTALATEMHHRGIATLEEFFGVPGGETYR